MLLRMRVLLMFAAATVSFAQPVDVLVVGAGPGGLSTALEAGRRGARVTVVDISSVFGGHAVVSEGGLSLVGTPLQARMSVVDSPEIAARDFLEWGEDADVDWVRRYTAASRPMVHDWLTAMGLEFTSLRQPAGNSVPRFHENAQRGFGVMRVIYRECLRTPTISFAWNTRISSLIREGNAVVGARGVRLRTGENIEFRAKSVVLATGGYQSDVEMVRRNWPVGRPPAKVLTGSGVQSLGSGLKLATDAGASLTRMTQQWNYTWGFPDPRDPKGERGVFIRVRNAIWVNRNGERFVDEVAVGKYQLDAISKQPDGRYWAIFDDAAKSTVATAGTDWANPERVEKLLFGSPEVKKAGSLGELAKAIGVPEGALARTVERYNGFVERGKDEDHRRFGFGLSKRQMGQLPAPRAITGPVFYAMPLYVVTRKSLGGVRIDASCRALTAEGQLVPGLFAVGEVTGFGGINGRAGLEGTFIGPAILQGRIVGQALTPQPREVAPVDVARPKGGAGDCAGCHDVKALTSKSRDGYWHFERVHKRVLENGYECLMCHRELAPFRAGQHKIDRVAQIGNCTTCH